MKAEELAVFELVLKGRVLQTRRKYPKISRSFGR
jgi:hypothetical protein